YCTPEKAPSQHYFSCRSFRPPLVLLPQSHEVIHVPQSICHASSHCRTHAQCTMNLDEVVSEISQRDRSRMILQFAREPIAQTCIASAVGSQCPVLPFDIAGADVFRVWGPAYDFHVATDAAGRRVTPRIFIRGCAVDFLQLAVINLRTKRSFNCFQIRPVPVTGDLYPLAQA